jgi:hypothetical protein
MRAEEISVIQKILKLLQVPGDEYLTFIADKKPGITAVRFNTYYIIGI